MSLRQRSGHRRAPVPRVCALRGNLERVWPGVNHPDQTLLQVTAGSVCGLHRHLIISRSGHSLVTLLACRFYYWLLLLLLLREMQLIQYAVIVLEDGAVSLQIPIANNASFSRRNLKNSELEFVSQ